MISNAAQSILDRRTILAQSNDAESFIAARDTARQAYGIWWAEKGAFHVVRVRDMVVEQELIKLSSKKENKRAGLPRISETEVDC